jgi:putative hydrolase of HD superfamily
MFLKVKGKRCGKSEYSSLINSLTDNRDGGGIMINKGIIERFYEAASIQRWNDHARPLELTELGKQAHKMVIAYVLARAEESERQVKLDWRYLIEGGLFEFLHRVILTDIKPPVFHQMMRQKGKELNQWVLGQLKRDIGMIPENFQDKFYHYFFTAPPEGQLERRILKAAHYLATKWEFRLIYNMNRFVYGIEKTRAEIEAEIEDYYDLAGVQKLLLDKKLSGFIDLCGQLRFQQRWAQSPRIPKTAVLDHMLIVAMLSYLCSLEIGAGEKRLYNNYFAALFHDLPEVLTRDIVSPIKSSVAGLQGLIKEYEDLQIKERLLPLLPPAWHEEILYFIEDEFSNKIRQNGRMVKGIATEAMNQYNEDVFSPVDGNLLRACDHLAAFIEAALSIKQGIKSHHLEDGEDRLYQMYCGKTIAGIDFGKIFDYFY